MVNYMSILQGGKVILRRKKLDDAEKDYSKFGHQCLSDCLLDCRQIAFCCNKTSGTYFDWILYDKFNGSNFRVTRCQRLASTASQTVWPTVWKLKFTNMGLMVHISSGNCIWNSMEVISESLGGYQTVWQSVWKFNFANIGLRTHISGGNWI